MKERQKVSSSHISPMGGVGLWGTDIAYRAPPQHLSHHRNQKQAVKEHRGDLLNKVAPFPMLGDNGAANPKSSSEMGPLMELLPSG